MDQSHTFIAIYSGYTISTARLVAASSDPDLVSHVAEALLKAPSMSQETAPIDPVATALENGQRQALTIIAGGKE